MATALIEKAASGDVAAIREVFDRIEGKPTQTVVADVGLTDWRTLAEAHQLDKNAILAETVKLLRDGGENLESSGE